MNLFMFREIAEPQARHCRSTRIWPSVYALHPTLHEITPEEQIDIIQKAGIRYANDRKKFEEIHDQVIKEIKTMGLNPLSDESYQYLQKRLTALQAPRCNMAKSIEEVLTERGFKVITTKQEILFQAPLNKIKKESIEKYPPVSLGGLDRLLISNAINILELLYGINTDDLVKLLSGK